VSIVDPALLQPNPLPPPVLIEELIVDGRPVGAGGLVLAPGPERVGVRYTALSLLDPAKVGFKYRLEGFDTGWVDAGTARTASYTRLPYGSYTFRVIAANNDGLWNERGAALAFRVAPHFYETRLFLSLCVGLVLAAAGTAYGARVRHLKRREQRLVAIVAERTRDLFAEKSRAEAALQTAEQASRAKTTFLATMSHELRTPLSAILGFAQLMQRQPARSADDRQQLGIIQSSGQYLLGLINDILSIAQIEAGDVRLRVAPFDPLRCLRTLADLLRPRAEAKALRVMLDVPGGLPASVAGDEGKLRQVLINLVGNAVKFTESGQVTLRAMWRDGRGAFEVEDTGPGISADEQARLFEPFVQTATGVKALEGTGLGLAISRRYVRLMGGELTVTSRPGQGATFRFDVDLPLAEPASVAVEHVAVGLAPGQRVPRILVVDDVEENRTLLARVHDSFGIAVSEAGDSRAALAMWRANSADLIWMDVRMDTMDGPSAVRAIRAEEARAGFGRSRVPIIAVTASAFEHEREGVLAAGFDDFVIKPFAPETVVAKLAEHLGLRFQYDTSSHESAVRVQAGAGGRGVRAELARPAERGGITVLVVEDHVVNQGVIRAMLDEAGCRADIVASGREALEALAPSKYALVFMDCHLPGMDGYATTAAIRHLAPPASSTPIVALTAHAGEGQRERCLAAGMDDYLEKPIDAAALAAVLDRWLPSPSIDREALAGLRSVAPAALETVIDNYLRSTPTEIAALRCAAADGDVAALRRGAHSLKGSSSVVGARALAHLCERLATVDGSDPSAAPIEIVGCIEEEFSRVKLTLLRPASFQQ
jgi:signal transduction histidine kinase/DNA-binding response OmpR family regulator